MTNSTEITITELKGHFDEVASARSRDESVSALNRLLERMEIDLASDDWVGRSEAFAAAAAVGDHAAIQRICADARERYSSLRLRA